MRVRFVPLAPLPALPQVAFGHVLGLTTWLESLVERVDRDIGIQLDSLEVKLAITWNKAKV